MNKRKYWKRMEKKNGENKSDKILLNNALKFSFLFLIGFLFVLLIIENVFGIDWIGSPWTTTINGTEDSNPSVSFNLSEYANATAEETPLRFVFGTGTNISSTFYGSREVSFYTWISLDSSTGILTINSTSDNQTGEFDISADIYNNASSSAGAKLFHFNVTAVNDAPRFSVINDEYNLTYLENFLRYINATDEEQHYPLYFNISFTNDCVVAPWSTRLNCSLLQLVNFNNISARMNFTPTMNDVGIYHANISVRDSGQNYSCATGYCAVNYSQNKTTYYSKLVNFSVLPNIEINATNCQNKIFSEGSEGVCNITIITTGAADSLNVSSLGFLTNYPGSVLNSSWFYSTKQVSSANFQKIVEINATPSIKEVGNWTINFTVKDLTSGENSMASIYVYVANTSIHTPLFKQIANVVTSIDLVTRINVTSYDDGFFVPDKLVYNELLSFGVKILNQSNLNQELIIPGFSVQVLNMPVAGTNRTEAKIEFTPNASVSGEYTINLTASDVGAHSTLTTFNLSIINNNAPLWLDVARTFVIFENNNTYLNFSANASDPNGDALSFSFTNYTSFKSFGITSAGIVNFTALDEDVGEHIISITVSDGYLTNTTSFNFTVYNINDLPTFDGLNVSGVTNATVDSNFNLNASEDNYTTLVFWLYDNDIKIPENQKNFYNETHTINLSISGPNLSLFTLVKTSSFPNALFPNRSEYRAIFTPGKSDVGQYKIVVNATDRSNASTVLQFNLTVFAVTHFPTLSAIGNMTSIINQASYYRFSAVDIEDGNSTSAGNLNFTFSYSFISGMDFIANNSQIFNITSGILNITFNQSQAGAYRINISVNDSTGLRDSKNFWIFVYGFPSLISPLSSYQFNLAENRTSSLVFRINHSVGDNLTYYFYVGDINGAGQLKHNLSYYGNASELNWTFTPNFTEEILIPRNLTVLVLNPLYPKINSSFAWNITINHTNFPIRFFANIGKYQADYNTAIVIGLRSYLEDLDHFDVNYNQTANFTITSDTSPSRLASSSTVSSSWNLTIPAPGLVLTEFLTIFAQDIDNSTGSSLANSTSNAFEIQFTAPAAAPQAAPSSGGGGSSSSKGIPFAFKLITSGKVSGFENQKLYIPLVLKNTGQREFSKISMAADIRKNGELAKNVSLVFSKSYFESVAAGESVNFSLEAFFGSELLGDYELIVNATAEDPAYNDWAQISVNIKDENSTRVEEFILFTQEFIAQNPQCAELSESLADAKKDFEKGDLLNATLKLDKTINACKQYISQVSLPKYRNAAYTLGFYLIISIAGAFVFGLSYYFIKRRRFIKSLTS